MTMSERERAFHRKTAVRCFNRTWAFLEKENRDAAENREMLHLAHASRFHWSLIGLPRNLAVGDWQISRAYAAIGQPELALKFAQSSLEICERNDLKDILPSAYEGIARAWAESGSLSKARLYVKKAKNSLASLALDEEDTKIYLDQIQETQELIREMNTDEMTRRP